jgi:hypothetical protein
VVPVMGCPGLRLTDGVIKLAQQNYGEHHRAIKALADRFQPAGIFPPQGSPPADIKAFRYAGRAHTVRV